MQAEAAVKAACHASSQQQMWRGQRMPLQHLRRLSPAAAENKGQARQAWWLECLPVARACQVGGAAAVLLAHVVGLMNAACEVGYMHAAACLQCCMYELVLMLCRWQAACKKLLTQKSSTD